MKTHGHEPTREELLRAFGETPPAFRSGINATLRNLTQDKEARIVKRKLTITPVLVLILAVLLAGVAVAAALYPGTVERFSKLYGEAFGARLAQGDIAQSGESFTLGDVTYTVSDVIYEGGVLYGTIVMEPAEGANVLLIPEDVDVNEPVGYNVHYGETAPEGTKSYKELAQESGARIVLTKGIPDGYVLEGELLSGGVGYTDLVTPEGTVVSSFELYGWNGGIERAECYNVRIDLSNWEVTTEGEWLREEPNNTWQRADWDVTLTPVMSEQETQEVEAVSLGEAVVVVPEGYDGALPSYEVTQVNYTDAMLPEMITGAEVAREERDEFGSVYSYTFADDDQLAVGRGQINFAAYDGTEEILVETENGEKIVKTIPHEELAQYLFDLASWEWFTADDGRGYMQPEETEALTAISLEQAQEKVSGLLKELGQENADIVYVLAMDMQRAKALSDARNAAIEAGEILNSNPYDMADMTLQDEGYLLVYRARVNGVPVDDQYMAIQAFVTVDGIRSLSLSAPFVLCGTVDEPQTLISAEDALAAAVDSAKRSWISSLASWIEHPYRLELIYTVRDKTKLVPAWQILAMDGEGEDAWPVSVIVSAVDGAVLNAPWM